MKTRLEQGLSALHLSPTPSGTLERYCSLLLEQNQMMNLTAITDPDQVVDLHMLDSAALLTVDDFSGKKVIDVGTGAGFPGMVLKVLEPTIELTLLDSLGKRVKWLSELSAQLGAAPVECIHGRAEEQALLEGYRDCYDLAVSRAVADLRILAELCLPFVKVGGRFLAMKSDNCRKKWSAPDVPSPSWAASFGLWHSIRSQERRSHGAWWLWKRSDPRRRGILVAFPV